MIWASLGKDFKRQIVIIYKLLTNSKSNNTVQ